MTTEQEEIEKDMRKPRMIGIALVVVALVVTAFVLYLIASSFA